MGAKMSYWVVAAAVLIVCAWALAALAEEAAPSEKGETAVAAEQAAPTEKAETTPTVEAKVYDPANTKVAILPFAHTLGRKADPAPRFTHRACDRATNKLRGAFGKRGFRVLDQQAVTRALKKLGVQLSRPEQRSLVTYQNLAEEVGADLVVCGALLAYQEDPSWGRKGGLARIELSVFDANAKRYGLYATQEGAAGRARTQSPHDPGLVGHVSGTLRDDAADNLADALGGVLMKGSTLPEMAVEDGIVKAITDFLKPYPEKKK